MSFLTSFFIFFLSAGGPFRLELRSCDSIGRLFSPRAFGARAGALLVRRLAIRGSFLASRIHPAVLRQRESRFLDCVQDFLNIFAEDGQGSPLPSDPPLSQKWPPLRERAR